MTRWNIIIYVIDVKHLFILKLYFDFIDLNINNSKIIFWFQEILHLYYLQSREDFEDLSTNDSENEFVRESTGELSAESPGVVGGEERGDIWRSDGGNGGGGSGNGGETHDGVNSAGLLLSVGWVVVFDGGSGAGSVGGRELLWLERRSRNCFRYSPSATADLFG